MFSQTSEYAVRAVIEIATREPGASVLSSELATALNIPHHYLPKILKQLVRTRVLKSVRGRGGGFSLARTPKAIKLYDVVEPYEDMQKYDDCILGQPVCSDAGACPLHDFWSEVRQRYISELKSRTLEDLQQFHLKALAVEKPRQRNRAGSPPGKRTARTKANKKSAGA
ncbi:MAG: Rrf2 family transcriptional regulator [Planctomycetes bacterium]|nr:Rrf2 family transcriptional regulator [Planctomycetota bacterium]